MIKRAFDIIISLLGCLLLIPLFVLIALFIRFESKGPIIFKQDRVGLNGSLFTLLKFRTMYQDSETKGTLTIGDDNRITSVGFSLRKFKIDELPQLFNVLLGNMSIVGPRPELKKYIDSYDFETKKKILSVRPGITERASINFIDEASLLGNKENPENYYINEILPVKQQLHVEYVENRSFVSDFIIILQTIYRILKKK